jgi:hypothetical protein
MVSIWIKSLFLLCAVINLEGHMITMDLEIKLISFLRDNGYKRITFVNYPNGRAVKMMAISFDYGLQSRFLPNISDTKVEPLDFLVINLENLEDQTEQVPNLINTHKIQRSLVLVHDSHVFELLFSRYLLNSLFYIYEIEESKWKQVLILKGNPQIVLNHIDFNKNGLIVVEEDLHGIQITTTSSTWNPYVIISGCNSQGLQCNYQGPLVDLMNFWSKKLNFTWSLHENKDWGLMPKSGKNNTENNSNPTLTE